MRFGRSRANGAMRQVVRQRGTQYDLTRPTQSSGGRFGEHSESTTTISDVELWAFNPEEVNVDTEGGDRLGGDMQALSMPSANIAVHDRLTHGGDEYEVQRIMHLPDNDNKVLKMFALSRRTNDDSTV